MHTAIDAYNLGYHIQVIEPAVALDFRENHKFAPQSLAKCTRFDYNRNNLKK